MKIWVKFLSFLIVAMGSFNFLSAASHGTMSKSLAPIQTNLPVKTNYNAMIDAGKKNFFKQGLQTLKSSTTKGLKNTGNNLRKLAIGTASLVPASLASAGGLTAIVVAPRVVAKHPLITTAAVFSPLGSVGYTGWQAAKIVAQPIRQVYRAGKTMYLANPKRATNKFFADFGNNGYSQNVKDAVHKVAQDATLGTRLFQRSLVTKAMREARDNHSGHANTRSNASVGQMQPQSSQAAPVSSNFLESSSSRFNNKIEAAKNILGSFTNRFK